MRVVSKARSQASIASHRVSSGERFQRSQRGTRPRAAPWRRRRRGAGRRETPRWPRSGRGRRGRRCTSYTSGVPRQVRGVGVGSPALVGDEAVDAFGTKRLSAMWAISSASRHRASSSFSSPSSASRSVASCVAISTARRILSVMPASVPGSGFRSRSIRCTGGWSLADRRKARCAMSAASGRKASGWPAFSIRLTAWRITCSAPPRRLARAINCPAIPVASRPRIVIVRSALPDRLSQPRMWST